MTARGGPGRVEGAGGDTPAARGDKELPAMTHQAEESR